MTKVFLVKLMYFSISIIFFFIVIIYIYIYITFTFSQFYILESELGYRRYINIVYLICLLHYLKAVRSKRCVIWNNSRSTVKGA